MSKVVKNYVGIDVSKLTFDVAFFRLECPGPVSHCQFRQSTEGYLKMKNWLLDHGVILAEETLVCMEHTGIYNTGLIQFLSNEKSLLWVEMALRIKRSQGFDRQNNDKTDAMKIARYAMQNKDKARLWSPTDADLAKIKHRMAQRDRIVNTIQSLKVPVEELKAVGCIEEAKAMEKVQKKALNELDKAQKKLESEIVSIIQLDKTLTAQVNRITTIKGIGMVTAVAFLVYTNGFTSFSNAKELSCYCGVVPFKKKESGTSVKSKARVSSFANMKLKTLLHLCAMSAIKHDNELKAYFERKVLEGKNKMSVINAVRNKLVLRMFALVRDERDYVENYIPMRG